MINTGPWPTFFKALLLALVLALIPVTAVSAQKITPGSACKSVNQKVTYQKKTYTCIKSGKKLVWNKGVAVKKPTPQPTPTAIGDPEGAIGGTPTPTPTPTPTQTPKNLTPLEKMNSDIYARYVAADKKINPSFNFVRCPDVDKAMADITETAYIDAYSFWVGIYKAMMISWSQKPTASGS